jgi:hypothetical protein
MRILPRRLEFNEAVVEYFRRDHLLKWRESTPQLGTLAVSDKLVESFIPEAPEVVIVEPLLLAKVVSSELFIPIEHLVLVLFRCLVNLVDLGKDADGVSSLKMINI